MMTKKKAPILEYEDNTDEYTDNKVESDNFDQYCK